MVSNLLMLFAAQCSDSSFLGFLEPWYAYLPRDAKCGIDSTKFVVLGPNSSIPLILLAIVDDLLRLAGLLAVVFVVYAGVRFIASQGSPDEVAKARTGILYALGGLATSILAVTFVTFLAAALGGTNGGKNIGRLDLTSLPNLAGTNVVQTLLSITFGVIGAVSVLIMVIGGIKYVLSQGDPKATAIAKSTIIYALVGLIVVIVAQSIVSLVVHLV